MGVTPNLNHFKQALKACQRAASGGRGSDGLEGVPQGWEAAGAEAGAEVKAKAKVVTAAVAVIPEIFRLIREADVTPDDECYALATM